MRCPNKKFAVLIFIALILFLIAPKPVSASVPVWETNPAVTFDIPNITEMTFEWAFKMAGEVLKRQLLNMIVDQIVMWIQGGGNPKFITDWPGFFRDAVDQAGGKFLQQIGLSQLCSPFKPLFGAAFIPIPTFAARTSCTLSRVGANLDAFLKDFKSGGWVAWQEMVLKPQNNVYGAYILAWDQYEIEKSAAAKAAAAEAQAGRGFLSVRRCLEWNSEGLQACVDSGSSAEECKKASCIKYEIVTPGAVVGDLAAKAVGSDIDYIVNAQDFKAYVAAITNAILNRVFAEGMGLLRSALSGSTGGGGGGGSAFAQAQCVQLLGTAAYSNCLAAIQAGVDVREFQKNYLTSLINQDLAYQNQLLGAKQATLTVLNQSVDILKQLETCQNSVTYALANVQANASTTASQITKIQSDIIALQIKQQEIKAITDVTQIPSLWAQVASVVNPALTYSLVLSAQQETSQKQQDMSFYQQQLTSCLQRSRPD